jgi:hypothetical protein
LKPTEHEARLQAEAIAAKYSYWVRSEVVRGMRCFIATCDELRSDDIVVAKMSEDDAMWSVKEAAITHVAQMLRNGETPPPPRGDR